MMKNSDFTKMINRRTMLKLLGLGGLLALNSCVQETPASPDAAAPPNVPPTEVPPQDTPTQEVEQAAPTEGGQPTVDNATEEAPVENTVEMEIEYLVTPLAVERLQGNAWMNLPVVPESLHERSQRVFRLGQRIGRDARRFSVIGDCQSIPVYFLTAFDGAANRDYFLGEQFANLQETIDYYKGAFGGGVAANGGQNVAAVFSPIWSNPELCESAEGPLACELRLSNSCLALISLEENWNGDLAGYEQNLVDIVKFCIQQGVVPVLTTKASNLEGDHSINRTIVDVAQAYGVPLWNFWASLQGLPDQGLLEDGFHLTQGWSGRYDYRDVDEIKSGWAMRNLTALELLDFLRQAFLREMSFVQRMAWLFEERTQIR